MYFNNIYWNCNFLIKFEYCKSIFKNILIKIEMYISSTIILNFSLLILKITPTFQIFSLIGNGFTVL